MSANEKGEKCTMCFLVCDSHEILIKHIVRCHRQDPRFLVRCTISGCSATFNKWDSYRHHVLRKHPVTASTLSLLNAEERLTTNSSEILGVRQHTQDILVESDEIPQNFDQQPFDSAKHYLQWHAAKFLINIRENCKVSKAGMQRIIDGVTLLFSTYSNIILAECRKLRDSSTDMLQFDDIEKLYLEQYPCSILFASLKSESALDKYLIDNMNFIVPEEILLYSTFEWKRKKGTCGIRSDLREVNHYAYIVPFIKNLRSLLMNQDIRLNIENPLIHEVGVYKTVLDGLHYREENSYFRENPNSLAIILYYDDLGIANPSGTASKTQKLSMFYWTLANIKPNLRSSKNAIQLLAIVKTKYLKRSEALSKILKPFIDDIITLQVKGVDVSTNGSIKNYKGSLLFFAGDTPASALIGGFKESVAANHLCRTCMANIIDFRRHFKESHFIIRNENDHKEQLEVINEPNLARGSRAFWQKMYGINSRSPLMDVPHFDVTKCLPQDCMHILLEGVTEITCRLFLHYCIKEIRIFSFDQLNLKLASFNFSYFTGDKPGLILASEFSDHSPLRQSAAQMFVLAHTLPFLINEWILEIEDVDLTERVDNLIMMLQIMNLCLAFEIMENSINLLSCIIEVFLSRFVILYPDKIVPKFHFLIHIPRYIKLFGPARQQCCFRFESAHAYFKSLVPVVRNFKNMPYTMSYRHQARLCAQLASYPGQSSKVFLYEGDKIAEGPTLLLMNLPYAELLYDYVTELERPTCRIMRPSKIKVHDSTYQRNSIVLLECEEDAMPVFGEVDEICILASNIFLIILSLETVHYECKLNAYEVTRPENSSPQAANLKHMIFPHPLPQFMIRNIRFVPLINHERCEFIG